MVDEIIERIFEWYKKGEGYPYQIQIHPTNYCNLKCIFCPTRALVKKLNRKSELKKEDWIRIIREGNKLKVKEWHICGGGEPFFFRQDTLAIMKEIKEENKYGEIITNGTFFDNFVAKTIVEIGWDKIYVSLDSPFAKTQNYLRQTNCFNQIINGVKRLVKWKKRLKKEKPYIYFHVVVCNKNYTQIREMVKLVHRIGIDGFYLNALNIWKPEINKLKLNDKEETKMKEILEESKKLSEKLKVTTNIKEFLSEALFKKANVMNKKMVEEVERNRGKFSFLACYYPWYNISIFADGNTLPCFILKEKGENVKEKSLKEIWFGEIFEKIRKSFFENKLKEDCAKCNPWNLPLMRKIRENLKNVKS